MLRHKVECFFFQIQYFRSEYTGGPGYSRGLCFRNTQTMNTTEKLHGSIVAGRALRSVITKLTIIIAINCFIIIVNFRNRFDKALTEIFQFRRALVIGL